MNNAHAPEWEEAVNEPATAEYFATVSNGKIVVLTHAIPPHALLECQFQLTREEYELLRLLDKFSINKAQTLIKNIRAKIKANGS